MFMKSNRLPIFWLLAAVLLASACASASGTKPDQRRPTPQPQLTAEQRALGCWLDAAGPVIQVPVVIIDHTEYGLPPGSLEPLQRPLVEVGLDYVCSRPAMLDGRSLEHRAAFGICESVAIDVDKLRAHFEAPAGQSGPTRVRYYLDGTLHRYNQQPRYYAPHDNDRIDRGEPVVPHFELDPKVGATARLTTPYRQHYNYQLELQLADGRTVPMLLGTRELPCSAAGMDTYRALRDRPGSDLPAGVTVEAIQTGALKSIAEADRLLQVLKSTFFKRQAAN